MLCGSYAVCTLMWREFCASVKQFEHSGTKASCLPCVFWLRCLIHNTNVCVCDRTASLAGRIKEGERVMQTRWCGFSSYGMYPGLITINKATTGPDGVINEKSQPVNGVVWFWGCVAFRLAPRKREHCHLVNLTPTKALDDQRQGWSLCLLWNNHHFFMIIPPLILDMTASSNISWMHAPYIQ